MSIRHFQVLLRPVNYAVPDVTSHTHVVSHTQITRRRESRFRPLDNQALCLRATLSAPGYKLAYSAVRACLATTHRELLDLLAGK